MDLHEQLPHPRRALQRGLSTVRLPLPRTEGLEPLEGPASPWGPVPKWALFELVEIGYPSGKREFRWRDEDGNLVPLEATPS